MKKKEKKNLPPKKKKEMRDFLGHPVVKTWPSIAGVEGSIPGQKAKIPHALQPENQNIKRNPETIL